ncbi:WYL domain-containing protein [Paenibacillus sp. GCM10028914]|uniref:WYL domain-containing protein n=1 Tax=Paenibacillus sp. GCM10028914 TaxID=3273416 RepID=UPI003611E84E
MNLFEKIFNYQIVSRLEDSGTFMSTSHERSWLRTMLNHSAADIAFTEVTLDKLRSILEQEDQVMDTSYYLIEKARSMEKQVYHPLLRALSHLIMNKNGICLTYGIKGGRVHSDHSGFPYKLEYSMVKREWYLLWYHLEQRNFMKTRLHTIISFSPESISLSKADEHLKTINQILDSRKTEAVIEVVPSYNEELSRILYALSSFEKETQYDAENDIYRVRICYSGDEAEYLLSKIRFLGKRVRIVQGDYLKRRMIEASTKALARYESTPIIYHSQP